jgi:hypothetical protein
VSYPVDPEGGAVSVTFAPSGFTSTQFEVIFNPPAGGSSKTCDALLTAIAGISSDIGVAGASGNGSTWPTLSSANLATFNGCTEAAVVFNK